jgi:Zn finger protein HypA/HybF involved in hydrogenase expression
MSEWAYYLEPEYAEVEISAECKRCEKESDVESNVRHDVAHWTCPVCKYENETRIA